MKLTRSTQAEINFQLFSNSVFDRIRNWNSFDNRIDTAITDQKAVGNISRWSSVGGRVEGINLSKEVVSGYIQSKMFSWLMNQQLNKSFNFYERERKFWFRLAIAPISTSHYTLLVMDQFHFVNQNCHKSKNCFDPNDVNGDEVVTSLTSIQSKTRNPKTPIYEPIYDWSRVSPAKLVS